MDETPYGSVGLLRAAIKAVPQVKWALGVAGIMMALALGKAYFSSIREAVVGTLAMLVLMSLLVIFAALSKSGPSVLRLPVLFVTWVVLVLFLATAVLTVSSVFFSWPRSFSELSRLIAPTSGDDSFVSPREIVFTRQASLSPDSLPSQMLIPVGRGSDSKSILGELARKGSLTLDDSTLVIGPVGGGLSVTISVHTLALQHGARIVTNGNTLTIQAAKIVGGGSIVSFVQENLTPEAIGTGARGINGHDGGTVFVDSMRGIDGNLEVNLSGQNGGSGGQGASGSAGPAGARGSDAVQGMLDCRSGGGDGSKGGLGGAGQAGGDGGAGGNGGELILHGGIAEQESQIHFISRGGAPGVSGAGGAGGPGGPGGQGGSGSAQCSGGHLGAQGDPGPKGSDGARGIPGKDGHKSSQR